MNEQNMSQNGWIESPEHNTDGNSLSALDVKTTDLFPGVTVRKDLVNKVKGNALVPSYVLEFLLSAYATNTDQASIESGVDRVRAILTNNYVHREEANLIQSKIREKGSHRIIDRVQVALNEKTDLYEATFSNLGISQVIVDPSLVKAYPKLLVTGIWCMCQIGYAYSGDPREVPWQLLQLKPVQMSRDDRENYMQQRSQFTDGEWIDLLMQSIGFNSDLFSDRAKLLHLVRMVPFVERNYNLVELGPKGTGKSHIYSEFSPHGMLISGGEVTVAKLFVNNSNGHLGLVGYWDTVAFDEFAGKAKKAGRDLVDIMKNYMANKSFSRGVETFQGEASMVFVGNTSHNVPYMLKNSDLFEELPKQYHDPAFLDRIHFYLPGWEFEQIRSEMFTSGFGFVVDYLAEILHNLRDADYSDRFEKYFELSSALSTRDKDGIKKTFSGLMKLIYPDGNASPEQMEPLLRCAIEGRKRVKDQLCRIDSTMEEVEFTYKRASDGEVVAVQTLEELDYPQLYWRGRVVENSEDEGESESSVAGDDVAIAGSEDEAGASENANALPVARQQETAAMTPVERLAAKADGKQWELVENQRGITYYKLFGPYLAGAKKIVVEDAYVRKPYQLRNLAEFLEMLLRCKKSDEDVAVHLVTGHNDPEFVKAQLNGLDELASTFSQLGVNLTYEFRDTLHDRSITSDTGWEILPGRGLDIFQKIVDGDWLNPLLRHQQLRRVKECKVTYRRIER
ncbi:BREX system Lon protease-like protein BrxL [Bifidobacterium bifidum]|uniref:BREX system Lon protease-like protein BrxL n=1 Tax=Bifidobacterium bifidum TaxID=1681 RepID=UPI0006B310C8|nr:BREX system Lon protease-like protein BrxL [Bifidobacterium bifidum]